MSDWFGANHDQDGGRWKGVRLRFHPWLWIHAGFILFLGATVFHRTSGLSQTESVIAVVINLGLFASAILFHELGHVLTARKLRIDVGEIVLWPLGNFKRPSHNPDQTLEEIAVALAGPFASLLGFLICGSFFWLNGTEYPFWRPLAWADSPATLQTDTFSLSWCIAWFGFFHFLLFIANLLIALPLDGGRVLRAILAGPNLQLGRDSILELWLARTLAVVLTLTAIFRLFKTFSEPTPIYLVSLHMLALAGVMEWMVHTEPRMVEDEGFFEDGIFDYSQSLEQGYAPTLDPAPTLTYSVKEKESALTRWRGRRLEMRQQRHDAKELAETRRMDEILQKISESGQTSLTKDELSFLMRMSEKIRKNREEKAKS